MGFFRPFRRASKKSQKTRKQILHRASAVGVPTAATQQRKGKHGNGDDDRTRTSHSSSRDVSTKNTHSQQKTHLDHLRDLSAKHLEEHSNATTSLPYSDDSSDAEKIMMVVAASAEETCLADPNNKGGGGVVPFHILEPWFEPSPILQPPASLTEPALCAALEMLSFDALCGGRLTGKSLDEDIFFGVRPGLHVEEASLVGQYGIPREISFERRNSRQRSADFREVMEIMDHEDREDERPASFLRGFRGLGAMGRKDHVTPKVKVYCETPLPMQHMNSVEASTITWPAEFLRNGTLSTINFTDEHQM